jgi:choline dehydrogenase-like flavoprotein
MLIDARKLAGGTLLDADICVVGAGPAGLAVALHLARRGQSVLLVESGGWRPDPEISALTVGEVAPGSGHPPIDLYRPRAIGGGTTVWGGHCVLYDPIDFEPRPWVPLSGWPLSFDELESFYEESTRFCDAGQHAYQASTALRADARPFLPELDGSDLETDALDRFSRPSNLGRLYRRELETLPSVRLLHHATLTGIDLAQDARTVVSLAVQTVAGTVLSVRPRRVVLAMGALETVRMLLASDKVIAEGIGNGHGMLGRCYFSHLEAVVGELNLANGSPVRSGFETSTDRVYVRRRMRVADAAQRRLGIGNGIIRLHRPYLADAGHGHAVLSAAWLVKHVLPYRSPISWKERHATERLRATTRRGLTAAHWRNVASDVPKLLAFAPWWVWHRRMTARRLPSLIPESRSGTYPLCFVLEQAPNPDSRIGLSTVRDRFGLPTLKVDWRTCDTDRRTIKHTLSLAAETLASRGAGRFRYDEAEAVDSFVPTGGHQLGGARMSATPRHGVVDAQCRVHGVENLYVAGNAVLPTASHANPTLTTVALAIRLATHLGGLA